MAVNLVPTSKNYENLGVSLLRLNKLDESRAVFMSARIIYEENGVKPDNNLLENEAALKEHLDYRENQRRKQKQEQEQAAVEDKKLEEAKTKGQMILEDQDDEDDDEDEEEGEAKMAEEDITPTLGGNRKLKRNK